MQLSRNVGQVDRVLRLVAGVALLGLYGALEPPLRYLTLLGLVFIATAVTAACPLYGLLGISTRKSAAPSPDHERSGAWWRAQHPGPDDRTWPPGGADEWRPPPPDEDRSD